MEKKMKLPYCRLCRVIIAILIITFFMIEVLSGTTIILGSTIQAKGISQESQLISDSIDISSSTDQSDDFLPRIERLIEKEANDIYERRLRIPSNENELMSETTTVTTHIVINIDLEKQFYSYGEEVNFLVQLTSDFLPVVGEQVTARIYQGWDNLETTIYGVTDNDGIWQSAYLPFREGVYRLEVEANDRWRYAQFTVSSLGLFWRHPWEFVPGQEIRSFALVLNTSSNCPVENAQLVLQVREYDNEWNQAFLGTSDVNGICDVSYILDDKNSYNYEANLTVYANGKSASVIQWLWRSWNYYYEESQPTSRFEVVTTTDKPLYSPGERIYFRSLIWEKDFLTVSKKPTQVSAELSFVSPSGYTLFRKQTQTDENGVISDSITLDEDAELGDYSIITTIGSSSSTVVVRVDRYTLPDFRVSTSISPLYSSGMIIVKGVATAEYYFGKPVTQALAELTVIQSEKVILSKSGELSIKGEYFFDFSVPQSDSEYSILLTITDEVGRSVESSTVVQGRSEVEVYGHIYPYMAQPEEEIHCNVWAYDRSSQNYYWGSPVTEGSVQFKIYGIKSILGFGKSKMREFEVDLNNWGHASVSWSLSLDEISKFVFFKVEVRVITSDGRQGTTDLYYGYSRKVVEITTENDVFQPGDEVVLRISVIDRFSRASASVEGTLYVFDSEWDAIAHSEKTFSGTSSITLRLSPYAKSGQYLVGLHIQEKVKWTFDCYWWHYYQYVKTSFKVGHELGLTLTTDKDSYIAGEPVIITGSHLMEVNSPIIVEIDKRGIVDYYVLESSSSFTLNLENTAVLVPKFSIFAHLVDAQGVVFTSYLMIEVNGTVVLDIEFDKDSYEPGDEAEISLTMKNAKGDNIDAVSAVSIIDSSVYGVVPDPEEENEHFEQESYYPIMRTLTSWLAGDSYWWWIAYDILYENSIGLWRGGLAPNLAEGTYDTYGQAPQTSRSNDAETPEVDVKIRDNLPESAYWQPELVIPEEGTSLSLVLPDNIGEWSIRVVATTAAGQGVLHKTQLTTFLPFFVDLKKPLVLLQDDVIVLKGVAYNYLNETAYVDLDLDVSDGLVTLIRPQQSLIIPPSHLGVIEWPVYCQFFGEMNASLVGIARTSKGTWADGIRLPLSVRPNGANRIFRQGGYLNGIVNIPLEISSSAVSIAATLYISPGLADVALSSWERLIGYPYGCVEQTLSRILPDALVYAYLNQTNQLDSDTADLLENMITAGLSRLYAFQQPSGGWGWWSNDLSNAYMTAIILYGLGLVRQTGFEIDSQVLSSGADFLFGLQGSDNLWSTNEWRLSDFSFTAFAIRSLVFANSSYVDSLQVSSAYASLKAAWNQSKDSYSAALLLDGLGNYSILDQDFKIAIIDYIHSSAYNVAEGTYWEIDDTRWRALGGRVETTAVVITSLVNNDLAGSFSLIQRGSEWITSKQRSWGWGNTADTSAAIRALLAIAEVSTDHFDAEISVTLKDYSETYSFDKNSPETMVTRIIELDDKLQQGSNALVLTQEGTGLFFYLLKVQQILREDPYIEIESNVSTSPGSEFPVSVSLSPPAGEVRIVDLMIRSLETGLPLLTSENRSIASLTENRTFVFVYVAPSETTIYLLGGFEISYHILDLVSFERTQIPVVKHYGTIVINVGVGSASGSTAASLRYASQSSAQTEAGEPLDENAFDVRKSLSRTDNLAFGETVTISLEVTNTGQDEEYFLMLEDFISAGLEVDMSSLIVTAGISDASYYGDRVTIFIPRLAPGFSVFFDYRVIATGVQTSTIRPALLSSMYDEWVITSRLNQSSISSRLSLIDPLTQEMMKDIEKPEIDNQTSVRVITNERRIRLKIEGTASDDLGLGTVCFLTGVGETWTSEHSPLSGKSARFSVDILLEAPQAGSNELIIIVEVRDAYGNLSARIFRQVVEIVVLKPIPMMGIAVLILVAILSGFTVSRMAIHWQRKRLNSDSYT